MEKRILSLLLTLALMLTVVGCGQETAPATDETASNTEATEPAEKTTDSTEATTEDANYPFTVVNEIDGQKYEVVFEKSPERAVSLASFTTEIMLALGLEDKMAGYAYQDNEVLPEYADALAKVDELSDVFPTQEVLIAAKPDFVTGWSGVFSEKKYGGVPFFKDHNIKGYFPLSEYPNTTMDVVYKEFETMGRIFNVSDKATEIINQMKSRISAVQDKVKAEKPVTVFFYDSGETAAFTAGAGLPTDLVKLAGGENVFAGTENNWMEVSWEQIVEKNPDAIIIIDYIDSDPVDKKIEILKTHPALKNTNAVKNEKFMTIGLTDILAGERNVTAIEDIAKFLHPEAFK